MSVRRRQPRVATLLFGFSVLAFLPQVSAQLDRIGLLASQLKEPDPRLRIKAVRALGQLKDPAAIEPLLGALADGDPNVRAEIIEALGHSSDSRSMGAVLAELKDPSPKVRSFATTTLGMWGGKALDLLLAALHGSDTELRAAACAPLARIPDPRVPEPLIVAARDTDERVRLAATKALGDIDDPRTVQPLTAALNDPSDAVRIAAAKSLREAADPVQSLPSSLRSKIPIQTFAWQPPSRSIRPRTLARPSRSSMH